MTESEQSKALRYSQFFAPRIEKWAHSNAEQGLKAHDRLATVSVQINVIFLTAWIALHTTNHLKPEVLGLKSIYFVILNYFLHVLVLVIICVLQWKLMVFHRDSIKSALGEFATIDQRLGKIITSTQSDELADQVAQDATVAFDRVDSDYKSKNDKLWLAGEQFILLFLVTVISSCTGLFLLVK